MAAETVLNAASRSGNPNSTGTIPPDRKVLHEPFSWVPTGDAMRHARTDLADYADLACKARDVSAGVEVILSMLEQDSIDADCADHDGAPAPALVGPSDAGNLMRLCIVACGFLRDEAEESTSSIHRIAKAQAPTYYKATGPGDGDEELRAGAEDFLNLMRRVAERSDADCAGAVEASDDRDYPAMMAMVHASLSEALERGAGPRKEGYLRALTHLLCLNADGCGAEPGSSWDPIADTANSFARRTAHVQ